MHFHGYLWAGPKRRFDEEALRRPPHSVPPPDGGSELGRRYAEVVAGFPVVDLPPLETVYWLVKPRTLVRGTWEEPGAAAEWAGERVREYGGRFLAPVDPAAVVRSAAERLGWGGDVCHGFYLERPLFLSLAVVRCSPGRAGPESGCPEAPGP